MAWLVLQDEGRGSARKPLPASGRFTLGRLTDNAWPLGDETVSRVHCEITVHDCSYWLVDRSTHGTYLNGRRISKPELLKDGDEIRLGRYVFTFRLEDERRLSPGGGPREAGVSAAAVEQNGLPKDEPFAYLKALYMPEVEALKRRIHEQVLSRLKLSEMALKQGLDEEVRAKVEGVLDQVLREWRHELPSEIQPAIFRRAMLDELIGFGPLSSLLEDDSINDIMINGSHRVFIERGGKIFDTGVRFFDDQHVMTIVRRIVEPLGRRLDESSPMVDARLPDGSRVNAIIPPLALDGPSVTIRKFATRRLTTDDLLRFGTLTPAIAVFLAEAVRSRQNILISGGTGSGKTTLLNILSQCIPPDERIVTVEDSAELRLTHANLVRLEARPPNIEGKGRVTIRDLVINCLRMRPDRIIIGECRGAEAFDMMQAMNTGHDGSLTTIHANSPRDALLRLENMVLMAGYELPSVAIREQIASAIDIVIQQSRLVDGSRKIVQVSEITGREGNVILMQDIFIFEQSGFAAGGKVEGRFKATGNIPRFVEELKLRGDLRIDPEIFKG